MTWQILQMPEDVAELTQWLDRQLVGLHLRELVSELTGLHGLQTPDPISVDEILHEQREGFLAHGFGALSSTQLQQILSHPVVLFDLQDLVFETGSDYWIGMQREDDELQSQIGRSRKHLQATPFLSAQGQPDVTVKRHQQRLHWFAPASLASLATAACLLIAFFGYQWINSSRQVVPAVAWGWAKLSESPANISQADYFNSLAESAEEWFNKRPDDAQGVARRLSEFRQGCTALLLTDHPPLDGEEKQWLRSKCQAWAAKLDKHLVDLEAGEDPTVVRNQVDETINSLVLALRQRAKMI